MSRVSPCLAMPSLHRTGAGGPAAAVPRETESPGHPHSWGMFLGGSRVTVRVCGYPYKPPGSSALGFGALSPRSPPCSVCAHEWCCPRLAHNGRRWREPARQQCPRGRRGPLPVLAEHPWSPDPDSCGRVAFRTPTLNSDPLAPTAAPAAPSPTPQRQGPIFSVLETRGHKKAAAWRRGGGSWCRSVCHRTAPDGASPLPPTQRSLCPWAPCVQH